MLAIVESRPRAPMYPGEDNLDRQRLVSQVHDRLPQHPDANNEIIRDFARTYIITYLRMCGLNHKADQLIADGLGPLNPRMLQNTQNIAHRIRNCQHHQFAEAVDDFRPLVSREHSKQLYHTSVDALFDDNINWGRILSLLQFSAELAAHCAQSNLATSVSDVVEWTEVQTVIRVHQLVEDQGGWAALAQQMNGNSWNSDVLTLALSLGIAVTLVVGGFIAVKRIFS